MLNKYFRFIIYFFCEDSRVDQCNIFLLRLLCMVTVSSIHSRYGFANLSSVSWVVVFLFCLLGCSLVMPLGSCSQSPIPDKRSAQIGQDSNILLLFISICSSLLISLFLILSSILGLICSSPSCVVVLGESFQFFVFSAG